MAYGSVDRTFMVGTFRAVSGESAKPFEAPARTSPCRRVARRTASPLAPLLSSSLLSAWFTSRASSAFPILLAVLLGLGIAMPLSARAEDRSSEPGLAAGPGGAGRDPYVILDCHVAALGGWERLKAIRSRHAKGLLTIEGAGLSGTVEDWESHPAKKRQEIDLQIFRQVSGDNGEAA